MARKKTAARAEPPYIPAPPPPEPEPPAFYYKFPLRTGGQALVYFTTQPTEGEYDAVLGVLGIVRENLVAKPEAPCESSPTNSTDSTESSSSQPPSAETND